MHLAQSSLVLACTTLMLTACGGGDAATQGTQTVKTSTTATAACGVNGSSSLAGVQTWMYQLQGLTASTQVDALASQPYDMLVVDPTNTIKNQENFDTTGMVTRLHTKPDGTPRKVLAYIDVGQAESFRTYWTSAWQAPTATTPGTPDFILKADPDGWAGDYLVAFWDPRWQALWLGPNGTVAQLAREGFDGVYLDWVQGYADPTVAAAAKAAGIDPARAMVDFIANIRAAGQAINPRFAVIQQNASSLIDDAGASALLPNLDAISQEDTWFGGTPGATWDSPAGGDIAAQPADTQQAIAQLQKYCAGNLPVFTIDYALQSANAGSTYTASRSLGFNPLVSRIALSQSTTTPPWSY